MVEHGYCPKHQPKTVRSVAAAIWHKLYNSKWRTYRVWFLIEHPLCVTCEAAGKIEPATVVDHITPHRGVVELFWNPANHQSLCKPCHDRKTALEDGGFGVPAAGKGETAAQGVGDFR